jgi:hypothetical protein
MCDNKIPKSCNSSIYSEYANNIDKKENIKIILSYLGNLEITDNIVDVIIKLKDINCKDVSKLTSYMSKYNNIQTELDIYTKNRLLFIIIREYLVNIQNNINNIISTIIPQSANYDYINDPNGLVISYNFNVEKIIIDMISLSLDDRLFSYGSNYTNILILNYDLTTYITSRNITIPDSYTPGTIITYEIDINNQSPSIYDIINKINNQTIFINTLNLYNSIKAQSNQFTTVDYNCRFKEEFMFPALVFLDSDTDQEIVQLINNVRNIYISNNMLLTLKIRELTFIITSYDNIILQYEYNKEKHVMLFNKLKEEIISDLINFKKKLRLLSKINKC